MTGNGKLETGNWKLETELRLSALIGDQHQLRKRLPADHVLQLHVERRAPLDDARGGELPRHRRIVLSREHRKHRPLGSYERDEAVFLEKLLHLSS
mgnify:CR=1 FL=1